MYVCIYIYIYIYIHIRCLLQRISQILTAPPKLSSDENYNKMKMLVGSLKPGSSTYDQKLIASKKEKFFGNLKNIDSFYHADEWEHDYQKQLHRYMYICIY
jgi:hypothetical protein